MVIMGLKAERLIAEMEKTDILTQKELTFVEYAEQLEKFQEIVCRKIMGEEYAEGMRLEEAIFKLESKAREKGMSGDAVVRRGISSLRKVQKELAVSISGIKGEQLVTRTLEYVTRPDVKVFRNVYVADGNDETELDAVVMTDSGILILEVKKIRDDVTISYEGRLVHSSDACYDKIPLGQKMETKRRLLTKRLEELVAQEKLDIPVSVESLIVFSTPKGIRVNVDDKWRRDKWCFRTGLTKRIDAYLGKIYLSQKQQEQMGALLGNMETQVKRFELPLDFDEVRKNYAEAYEVLHEENDGKTVTMRHERKKNEEKTKKQKVKKWLYYAGAAACVAICTGIVFENMS